MTITYNIKLEDIRNLTFPMWEACGVECPAMIGGECPRLGGKGLPCDAWSAKFESAAAEVAYLWTLDSGQSEECGSAVDGDAWYALFRNPDRGTFGGPMGAGVIVEVLSSGAVFATRFESAENLEEVWADLLESTGESGGDDDEMDEDA